MKTYAAPNIKRGVKDIESVSKHVPSAGPYPEKGGAEWAKRARGKDLRRPKF